MLSRLYGSIIKARNSLYEKGFFKSFSLGAKTVSVGNITVGGTGKTPLVVLISEILSEAGEKVCVLSRGYGRDDQKKRVLVSDGEKILADARTTGDEPFEIARKLSGRAIVVSDANRVSAGNWAREKFGITAFVLDDAFQHRRVRRDINIVAIDATNPFGNEKLIPAGILREPLKNLKRADAIIITRANLAENVAELKIKISKYNQNCPIFISENKISALIELKSFLAEKPDRANYELRIMNYERNLTDIRRRQLIADNCFAFCALGNPRNFFEQLKQENFNVISTETFPDHYFYAPKDIAKLDAKARKANAKTLLTTAKDAVKLKNLKFGLPCFVVESELVFEAENDFRDWLISEIAAS